MIKTCRRTPGTLLCAVLAFAVIGKADIINIALLPPLLTDSPGSVISFSGSLLNTTGASVFLNSAGINLAGAFDSSDEDTSPFFANTPLFLDGGDSTLTIDLFTVTIPDPFPLGAYQGTFTVLGGGDGNTFDLLGSVDFTVDVENAVPEPISLVCLAMASALLLACRRFHAPKGR